MDLKKLNEPCIIVSYDLSPSITAQLDRKIVLGFGTDIGSKTSHTAIMARSLQIPAVVGLKNASSELQTGDYVLLDGYNGIVIVNPTDQTLFEYGQLVRRQASIAGETARISRTTRRHAGRKPIHPFGQHREISDIEAVLAHGAEGVGLFRTEYLFINRDSLPTEEEQYQAYHKVAAELKPQPGHHPHARSGRRQVSVPFAIGPGDEPVSGLARDPVLPGSSPRFFAPSSAPFCEPAPRETSK